MSGNNFEFLGIPAARGRTLLPEDARPGAPPVCVMRHTTWATRFGSDPGVLGRTLVLNGVPTTLVGIMPPRFQKMAADFYLPVSLDRADPEQRDRFFRLQARLKPGVTLAEAEAEVNLVARRVARLYPSEYPERVTVKVMTWVDNIIGQFRTTLYTLAAAVGLLLLIACSNVANMLLGRATTRERELAVRASLGATRARLVGQLLVESLLLALLGAAFGCLCSYFGIKALVRAIPEGLIPREAVIRLNLPVLLFSLGVAVLTALLCGLVPALRAARRDLVEPLKDSGKGGGGGFRGRRLNGVLVVAEVALSLVLLAGAALLMRSFVNLQTQDLGFEPDRVLHARLPLPRGSYASGSAKRQFFDQVLSRVQALPGVASASVTSSVPPFGGIRTEVEVPGRTHAQRWEALYELCSEGYFETLGLRPLRGRMLSAQDVADGRKVAVVNETLARRYYGDDDPVGRTIELKMLATLAAESFIPHSVTGAFDRGILVRTAGPPLALLESVRREIWAVDRNVAITTTGSLSGIIAQFALGEPRLTLVVLGVFAVLGLVLVALGVFSVVAYAVSRQTHEIGIRMALGAARADVLRSVVGGGLRLVGAGVGLGLLASLAATRVLSHQLFGVAPQDPTTMGLVAALMSAVGFLASYLPARRATRVDPLVALRHE